MFTSKLDLVSFRLTKIPKYLFLGQGILTFAFLKNELWLAVLLWKVFNFLDKIMINCSCWKCTFLKLWGQSKGANLMAKINWQLSLNDYNKGLSNWVLKSRITLNLFILLHGHKRFAETVTEQWEFLLNFIEIIDVRNIV